MLRKLRNNAWIFWCGSVIDGSQVIIGPYLPNFLLYFFEPGGGFIRKQVLDIKNKPQWLENAGFHIDTAFLDSMEAEILEIQANMSLCPGTIEIEEFFDDEHKVGILELPEMLQDFVDNPNQFFGEEKRDLHDWLQEWRDTKCFVFVWGDELWMSADGEVEEK